MEELNRLRDGILSDEATISTPTPASPTPSTVAFHAENMETEQGRIIECQTGTCQSMLCKLSLIARNHPWDDPGIFRQQNWASQGCPCKHLHKRASTFTMHSYGAT